MRAGTPKALVLFALSTATLAASAAPNLETARELAKDGKILALRVQLKRAAKAGPMDAATWRAYWKILLENPNAGYDLLYTWNRIAPEGATDNKINSLFDEAQDKALAKNFTGAAATYLRLAKALRPRLGSKEEGNARADLAAFYPFVLQGLGRALYGMGRYEDSLRVYRWLPSSFPRFRQALFEKMWAAFRAGNVDETLGAAAAQRSSFFETILEPEAFLIEVYLFRRLCRDDDAKASLAFLKDSERRVRDGTWGMTEWVRRDLETNALYLLSQTKPENPEEAEEAAKIRRLLEARFQAEKQRLLTDFSQVKGYSRLAMLPSAKHLLKPIEKLPSRQALLDQDLEIWPADLGEAWVDELGRYRFLGESKCASSP